MKTKKVLNFFSIAALTLMSVCVFQSLFISPAVSYAEHAKTGVYKREQGVDVCYCDVEKSECRPCLDEDIVNVE